MIYLLTATHQNSNNLAYCRMSKIVDKSTLMATHPNSEMMRKSNKMGFPS
jgi:hypothetical protein